MDNETLQEISRKADVKSLRMDRIELEKYIARWLPERYKINARKFFEELDKLFPEGRI